MGLRASALSLCVCLMAGGVALADGERGTFSFVLENDVFYNLDRDYTNGVQIGWTSGEVNQDQCWECDVARAFPLFEGRGQS